MRVVVSDSVALGLLVVVSVVVPCQTTGRCCELGHWCRSVLQVELRQVLQVVLLRQRS